MDANHPHLVQVYDALKSIMQMMDIHSRSLQKMVGVTAPWLSILNALAEELPLNVSQLSKKVHLSRATSIGTITRLEQHGLIQRMPSGENRRRIFFGWHLRHKTYWRTVLLCCLQPLSAILSTNCLSGKSTWFWALFRGWIILWKIRCKNSFNNPEYNCIFW